MTAQSSAMVPDASRRLAEVEDELARRGAILEAVRLAAERFLDPSRSWADHLPEVLAALARATGTSRVYLFENYRWEAGEVWTTQRFEWSAPGVRSIADDPVLAAMPMFSIGFGRWVELFRRGEVVFGLRRELPELERMRLAEDETLSIAVVPIMVDGEWWGMIGFDECAFERVWTPGDIDGLRAAASTIAAAIQASRVVDERAHVRSLLERRVRALSEVAASLTVDQPLADTLQGLCATAVDATDAVACSVQHIDRDGNLRVLGYHGLSVDYVDGLHRVWRHGGDLPTARALHEQEIRWVSGASDKALELPGYAPLHDLLREVSWSNILAIPLDALGRHMGVVNLYYPTGARPDADEETFLRAMADQAAAAVENARLYAAAQGTAALQERQRLARELHDSVSQALYGIALGAKTARTLAERDPAAVVEPLDYVLGLAEAGLAEMRALIFELRPEALASEGLVSALDRQLRALRARHGIEVDSRLGGEPDVALAVKEAFYRIAQEALHNVVKHAAATRVRLRLACSAGFLVLEVHDNGLGFDASASYPGHLGLHSMRERAEGVDGMLSLTSSPGTGTHLTVRAPATAVHSPPSGLRS